MRNPITIVVQFVPVIVQMLPAVLRRPKVEETNAAPISIAGALESIVNGFAFCLLLFSAAPDIPEPAWTLWHSDGDDSDVYRDITRRFDGGCGDVHENCHKLINRIQLDWDVWSRGWFVTYCLKGRIAVINTPPISLGAVAEATPESLKGEAWPLYMVSQRRHF